MMAEQSGTVSGNAHHGTVVATCTADRGNGYCIPRNDYDATLAGNRIMAFGREAGLAPSSKADNFSRTSKNERIAASKRRCVDSFSCRTNLAIGRLSPASSGYFAAA